MAGSFENLKYDMGAYQTDLRQSTAPLQWQLDPMSANSCSACRPGDVGYIGKQGVSISEQTPLIDVESDLMLLNYRNSRDPAKKFIPTCNQDKMFHFKECGIRTDYSRITNPACNLRGTGVNRFQPLCLNPQDEDRWLNPSQVGINYRMVVKDNHVPCIPVPNPGLDLLPPQNEKGFPACDPCNWECNRGSYSSPMYYDYYAKPKPCIR